MRSTPALVLFLWAPVVAQPAPDPVDVRLVSDEAEAALAGGAPRSASGAPPASPPRP